MRKINKKSINFSFKILTILAFSLLVIPAQASADYGSNYYFGSPHRFENDGGGYVDRIIIDNPKPVIYSISPKSADKSMGGKTITVNGKGFIPSSMAKINGANRSTTFIDSGHLLVQVNGTDMYRTDGGFYVTVWNGAPAGGFSNAEFFTVNNVALSNAGQNTDTNFYSSTVDNNYYNTNTENETFSGLTGNAVYGSNTFLPSGAIQWLFFAIIILLLVVLARKFFGGEDRYLAVPLKHD